MARLEITTQNLMEIVFLPLIFISIFIGGVYMFLELELYNYFLFLGWCLVSGGITLLIVPIYSIRAYNKRE